MAFQDINWTEVKPAGQGLPVGGYILRITKLKDMESNYGDYFEMTYDIAEGDYKDFYKDDEGWKHRDNVYYTDKDRKPRSSFRSFLDVLEESNKDFSVEEFSKKPELQNLIGLIFGGCIQKNNYLNKENEQKYSLRIMRKLPADKIRKGDFQMPEESYSDELKAKLGLDKDGKPQAPSIDASDPQFTADVPF